MGDKQDIKTTSRYTYENWKVPVFNSTTNFSLLGCLLAIFCKNRKDRSVVDFQVNRK